MAVDLRLAQLLAAFLIQHLRAFAARNNLGLVTGEGGMLRLFTGLVRIPDVAFVSWSRLPAGEVPRAPIPQLAPDLAVEILSRSNTPSEMRVKREEYFAAGVARVWMVDPENRRVTVYTSSENSTLCDTSDVLDGGEVLPGFSLRVSDLFAELDRRPNS